MKTAGLARGGGGAEAGDFEGAEAADGGGAGVGAGLWAPEGAGGRCAAFVSVLPPGWPAVASSDSESPEDSDSSSGDEDLRRFRWAPPRLLTFSWPWVAGWSGFLLGEQASVRDLRTSDMARVRGHTPSTPGPLHRPFPL